MGLRKALFFAGLGAAAAYFFDPVSGRVRRVRLQGLIDGAVQKAPNLTTRSSKATTTATPRASKESAPTAESASN